MQFFPMKDGMSVAKGSLTLKAISRSLSIVDLLVRESLQNSSDAALKRGTYPTVGVDFNFGRFDTKRFTSILNNEIKSVLEKRFTDTTYSYLEISDYNTCGLDGDPIPSADHVRSHFCRLVYDTGEAQDKKNAGGNWGYGKSVYYLAGTGIVIFYSRFEDRISRRFKSRLIITLVEDEKQPSSILRQAGYEDSVGKAWWGSEVKDGRWLLPIEDPSEIRAILGIFGVQSYEERIFPDPAAEKTGTSIIIPFVQPDNLLPKILAAPGTISDEASLRLRNINSSLETALKYAALRWYSPRLGNTWLDEYNRYETKPEDKIPQLTLRIGDVPVFPDMDSGEFNFFKAVQELYNAALLRVAQVANPTVKYDPPVSTVIPEDEIQIQKCSVQKILRTNPAGFVAFTKFRNSNAATCSPYILMNKYGRLDTTENPPIVAFLREPGMVVDYCLDGEWVKNVPGTQGNEFVLAVFIEASGISVGRCAG